MIDLLELSEMESDDAEMVPEILPVDARLAISGSAKTLSSMFQSALDVTPLKEIIPNTGYVQLEGVEQTNTHVEHVKVSATDGERTITLIRSGFSVKLSGSVLVPGKRILDILKLIGENSVRIDVLGTTATIRSGRAVWTVSTPASSAYLPSFSEVSNFEMHTLSAETLLRSLELVYPAIAKTAARQSLMQASVSKGSITSCDGVRAHKVNVDGLPKSVNTTLPLKFVESAIKELRSSSVESVEFGADHSTVVLHFGSNILMSQRLNFQYPDVEHLMLGPALSNDETLAVNVADLVDTVKRVRVNADPEFYAIFLSLRQTKGSWSLTVRARDREGNTSQETLPVSFEGSSIARDIVVNHKYLLEFLTCVGTEDVELKLGESTKTKQAPIYVSNDYFTGSLMLMSPNFVR